MANKDTVKAKQIDLANITSAKDISAAFEAAGMIIGRATDELGDGFQEIEKRQLIDQAMILLSWTFAESKEYQGNEYVIVRAMLPDDRKVFFTDGGAGIYKQLKSLTAKRADQNHPNPNAGLICNGLRLSEYDYTDDKGATSRAKTFYISA